MRRLYTNAGKYIISMMVSVFMVMTAAALPFMLVMVPVFMVMTAATLPFMPVMMAMMYMTALRTHFCLL